MIDELQGAHASRHIVLHVEGDLDGEWDSGRLTQVLSNLVEIVHAHGGTVDVRSTVEDGTAFTVTLPRRSDAGGA